MENAKKGLYLKLNGIIDSELEKGEKEMDTGLVAEAADALLRMKDPSVYQLTSKEREENIRSILGAGRGKKRLSKTARILLVAAVIIALLAVAVCGYTKVKYKLVDHGIFSEISFSGLFSSRIDEPVKVSYVPEGFVLTETDDKRTISGKSYFDNKGNGFSVSKEICPDSYTVDTEYKNPRIIEIGGIEYILFGDGNYIGVVFVKNNYVYTVSGLLSEETMLRIAQGLE